MNSAELTGELTGSEFPAILPAMGDRGLGKAMKERRRLLALPMLGLMALGGCISVKAPDKPIVIELNINIKQEVVYRLAPDAAETAKKNSSVF